MGAVSVSRVTRGDVEEFLFREAELLDGWNLDGWAELLTEDASYYVPPTDKPNASHETTLFIIADDIVRLRERIIRLKDPSCHVEYPPSLTRRMLSNVRIGEEQDGREIEAIDAAHDGANLAGRAAKDFPGGPAVVGLRRVL